MRELGAFALIVAVIAVVAGLIGLQISVWQECRTDHSWLYCVAVLGSR